MPTSVPARRPIKSRNTRWANGAAKILIRLSLKPNHISILSIVFSAFAGACLFSLGRVQGPSRIALYVGAAACIQLRLICNLLDGMVAVEGGFRTKSGDVFNELPDRISDSLILAPIGYSLPGIPLAVELGWAAALLAVMTAYVRALGASLGLPQDFTGPMAKPQRMAVITFACLLSVGEYFVDDRGWVLGLALGVVAAGAAITVARRTMHVIRGLEAR